MNPSEVASRRELYEEQAAAAAGAPVHLLNRVGEAFYAPPMKLADDLKSPRLIHLKGWLFLLLGLLAAAGLLLESPHLRTALLLAIVVWSFCRFYYYLFYVLERYLGKQTPYAGLLDALRFIIKK